MAWSAAAACFFGLTGLGIAATIITIIIISKSQQKALKHSSNNSVRHNGVDYRYDPVSKSIVESSAPASNDSNNNLKKRSPPSTIDKKQSLKPVTQSSEKSTDKKKNVSVCKVVKTDPVDVNQNNLDNPMSVIEKVNEYLLKNIPAPDLASNSESATPINVETSSSPDSSEWSSISSEKSTDSTRKNYKKKVHKSFKKYVNAFIERQSAENTDENSDTLSESDNLSSASSTSSWSEISSEKSTDDFEKAYKKKMHKSLRKFVKSMNKTEAAPSEYSDETSSVLSDDLKVCMACEKNPVNTRTQPCNHRYMCSDCAMKFYRIHKKCKVCRTRIEQYVVED